jgi:hypothetical protein
MGFYMPLWGFFGTNEPLAYRLATVPHSTVKKWALSLHTQEAVFVSIQDSNLQSSNFDVVTNYNNAFIRTLIKKVCVIGCAPPERNC